MGPRRVHVRLCRSTANIHADCERHPFEGIPDWIFLHTNVVNLIVKQAPVIFEMEPQDPDLPFGWRRDIDDLAHIFAVGARARWTLWVAEATLDEINRTLHEQ